MGRYFVARVLQFLPTVLVLTVLMFALMRFAGDPVLMRSPDRHPSSAEAAAAKRELGLDRPLVSQYMSYLSRLSRGDWGESYRYHRPVTEIIGDYYSSTFYLATLTLAFETVAGIAGGLILSRRRRRRAEVVTTIVGAMLVSMPAFWLAMLAQYLFAVRLGWAPAGSAIDIGWSAYVLPAAVLALGSGVYVAWITRGSAGRVLDSDYVASARSHGITGARLWLRHVLPNSLAPTVGFLGIEFGALLGGAAATEAVFNLPGLGNLIFKSVMARDRPVVIAASVVLLVGYMLANLAADVIHAYLDPRLRHHLAQEARS